MLDIRKVRLGPGFRTQQRISPENQLNSRRRKSQIHQSTAKVNHSPLCRPMDAMGKLTVAVDVFVKCDASNCQDDRGTERAFWVGNGFFHRLDGFVA